MGHTLTIRLPKGLATWIEDASTRTGISQGELVRQHLERARSQDTGSKKFMRLAARTRSGPRESFHPQEILGKVKGIADRKPDLADLCLIRMRSTPNTVSSLSMPRTFAFTVE